MNDIQLFRGTVVHVVDDPWVTADALTCIDDGVIVVADGVIVEAGRADEVLQRQEYGSHTVTDYGDCLLIPGLIDAHLHYPQTGMIGSYGSQLLEWLNRYTFPAEVRFADLDHAQRMAEIFVQQLYANGTTTAMVFATSHPHSVDALFNVARRDNMQLITGKVMMDRNCPESLQDTAAGSYEDSQALIARWHGVQRLHYAVTPRFAPTSTDDQLQFAGRLFADYDGIYLQSHVAENTSEVKWVAELFPWSRSYLDVYDHFGLLGDKAVYAHCIHLNEIDLTRMAETQTAMAFCPTSNLFLGSGLFDLAAAREKQIKVALATDVGAGTSFSMLRTADEAYKVCQLNGESVNAAQLLYAMTLGSATTLGLDTRVGDFSVGKDADFIAVDLEATPLMQLRMEEANSIEEKLFALMVLGDDRCVRATHIMGNKVYDRDECRAAS
jgi:guanine deaminase